MASFSSMLATVKQLVGYHSLATTQEVSLAINKQHSDLIETNSWSVKTEVLVNILGDVSAGTVQVTSGSETVEGTGTSFAAAHVGADLRISSEYVLYMVKAVSDATHLTLGDQAGNTVDYPGTSASGLSYAMFKRRYSIGTNMDNVISVIHQRSLTETSEEYLNWIDPYRTGTGLPLYFARVPKGSSDDVQLEFYPRSTTATTVRVLVQRSHTDMSGTDNPLVPSQVVEWFAASQIAAYLYAKTKDSKWFDLVMPYKKRGDETLEKALQQDQSRFGVIQRTQDRGGGVGLANTDFGVNHDVR